MRSIGFASPSAVTANTSVLNCGVTGSLSPSLVIAGIVPRAAPGGQRPAAHTHPPASGVGVCDTAGEPASRRSAKSRPSRGMSVAVKPVMSRFSLFSVLLVTLPFTMAAKGDGCAVNSRSPAPDLTGAWNIEYDDRISVEVVIGGAVYEADLPANGGVFEIVHDGRPLSFDLDCGRPEIVCPSEAWPHTVDIEQREEKFEHRMIVTLPMQTCSTPLRAPAEGECGPDTLNPDCDSVCDGEVSVVERETFGVIGEDGSSFRLYLGAGIA